VLNDGGSVQFHCLNSPRLEGSGQVGNFQRLADALAFVG
jgi:hypothetical protein